MQGPSRRFCASYKVQRADGAITQKTRGRKNSGACHTETSAMLVEGRRSTQTRPAKRDERHPCTRFAFASQHAAFDRTLQGPRRGSRFGSH